MKEKSLSDMILEILTDEELADDKDLTAAQLLERLEVRGWKPTPDGSLPTKAPHLRVFIGGRS